MNEEDVLELMWGCFGCLGWALVIIVIALGIITLFKLLF